MYVNGTKHFYEMSATKMLVQSELLDTVSMKNVIQSGITGQIQRIYQLSDKLVMVDMKNVSKGTILNLQEQWNSKENVIYTSPVLLDDAGIEIGGITNQVLIRLKSVQDYSLLTNSIATYNIQSVKLCDFDERTYLLTLDKSSNKDAMQIANELYETDMFEYAEPNLIHFIKFETNDTYFAQQWALNNTGQYGGTAGIDIKANQAWTITTGSSDVRIAILDLGVDLMHPDLQANLLTGFDATEGSGNGAATNNLPHGTSCAGIAAAIGNNNEGIAGVAYGCNILPVRIATTTSGWETTESQYIANGIDWAITNEASVISMSFTCVETNAVNTAISNAIASGRNNRGCLLIAASGNSNLSTVGYPARNVNVIAVGAISPCGQRKSPSSCDGESWGSNYGTNLDVVAPGVLIPTTDIQGNAGYNTDDGIAGNYYANFSGTSAACPHVAGIAALILSVRPDLTQAQVRQAIESTCTKLPSYSYSSNSGHPNGTWNNEVGHGLVDAYAAINSVLLSGDSIICLTPATYTLSAGFSATSWSVTPASAFTVTASNATSATVTTSNVTGQSGTLTAVVNGVSIIKEIYTCQLTISGESFVCPSPHPYTIYGISNLPTDASVVWSSGYNLQMNSLGNLGVCRSIGFGNDIIQAVVTLGSHSSTITRMVSAERIITTPVFTGPSSIPVDHPAEYMLTQWNSDLNYSWSLTKDGLSVHFYDYSQSIAVYFLVAGQYVVSVSTQNQCGDYGSYTKNVSVTSSGIHPPSTITPGVVPPPITYISPNPASSTLNFDINEEAQAAMSAQSSSSQQTVVASPGVCTVQLRAVSTGALALSQTVPNFESDFSLNVSAVSDGLYTLTLTQGNTVVHTQTIMIQH
jgi:subtilisin family serine protease